MTVVIYYSITNENSQYVLKTKQETQICLIIRFKTNISHAEDTHAIFLGLHLVVAAATLPA